MATTFTFLPGAAIVNDSVRDMGGTEAATRAQFLDIDFASHLNRAILEMQNFMDDVDTQFMTVRTGLSKVILGVITPNQSPNGSFGYNIELLTVAPEEGTVWFNVGNFRKAVKLWWIDFATSPPTAAMMNEIPRGTDTKISIQSNFTDAKYFAVSKSGGPIGQYELNMTNFLPASGTLDLEYSFYHTAFTTANLASQVVQMEPAYYPMLSLWVAFIALTMFPDPARAQSVLTRLGMQRIAGSRKSFSETDAYNNMLSTLYGKREAPTVPAS